MAVPRNCYPPPVTDPPQSLGIIAGNRTLPLLLATEARAAIEADLAEGFITPEGAARDY